MGQSNKKEVFGVCDNCGFLDYNMAGRECPICRHGGPAEILTDAQLDRLELRFHKFRALFPASLTFAQYVYNQRHYDDVIDHLMAGHGCRVVNGRMIPNRAQAVAA